MELNLTGGFFGLPLLILDIYAIVRIVGSGASTARKVISVPVVLFLPLIGLIACSSSGPRADAGGAACCDGMPSGADGA